MAAKSTTSEQAQPETEASAVSTEQEAVTSPSADLEDSTGLSSVSTAEQATDETHEGGPQAEARTPAQGHTPRNAEDENFGNRKDYRPRHGQSEYRSPMSQGKGRRRRHNSGGRGRQNQGHNQGRRRQRYQQQPEIEGVLSVRQPGWQERIHANEASNHQHQAGILTMRQQGNHQDLHWRRNQQSMRDNRHQHQRSRDPDAVWGQFMDDLRRGKVRDNDGRRRQKRRRRPNNSPNNKG